MCLTLNPWGAVESFDLFTLQGIYPVSLLFGYCGVHGY